MMATFLILALLLSVTLGVLFTKRSRLHRLVDRLPGPTPYPLIGNALQLLVPKNRLMKVLEERYQKYKPLYRCWIGPLAEIHLTLPEHVEVIMNNTKHIQKSKSYKFFQPWLKEGLLTSSGNKWHSRRKLITPTFHFKILERFLDVFIEKSDILTKKLTDMAGCESFDIYPYITHCALDIICETAMGIQINSQDHCDTEYVRAIHKITELTLERGMRPWLHPNFIYYFTQSGRLYQRCLDVLHGFTTKVIQERKQRLTKITSSFSSPEVNYEDACFGEKKRLAFLDLLLVASEDGNKLSDTDIREEVDTFMFEGHDTITAAISWTLLLLAENQDIQDKVHDELDTIFRGSDRQVAPRDIHNMKYLERVIKESLRLYPSVPFIGRILAEEVKIGGYVIPSNCLMNLHIFHVHRDPRNWPEPEKFDPDRFLPDRTQHRHPYAYIPFSAGPRNCIGQKFALMEEKTIISAILRKFRIQSDIKLENVVLMNEIILRPESGLQLKLTPRC